MPDPQSNILVFALSRAGCLPYAREMIRQLEGMRRLYVSAYADEPWEVSAVRISTFRSAAEFFCRSLTTLPRWLWQLYRGELIRPGTVAYFPVFHHWNLFVLLACRWRGVRSVLTVHNGRLHPGEGGFFQQLWHQWCIRLADELIFLSDYVRNQVQAMGLLQGKSHVIPHGLLSLPGLRLDSRTLSPVPRLLLLGRLEPYKGVNHLLEAFALIPADWYDRLTVAGMSRGYPIHIPPSLRVTVIDRRLTNEEMAALLNEHDILVLPYTEASQSGILTLGIRAAIPMVCSRVGGLPEQLSEEEAVFVPPTAEGLWKGVLRLLRDRDLYQRIHQNLVARRADAGWGNAGRQLREILRP